MAAEPLGSEDGHKNVIEMRLCDINLEAYAGTIIMRLRRHVTCHGKLV